LSTLQTLRAKHTFGIEVEGSSKCALDTKEKRTLAISPSMRRPVGVKRFFAAESPLSPSFLIFGLSYAAAERPVSNSNSAEMKHELEIALCAGLGVKA
jgi:hypothetical protein